MVDLSNNAIICMHQDQDNYIWIGTYDGLHLYNGKDTYIFRFELNNKMSLCSNIIHKISDAEPGYLWISTSLGINKFSLKERKVTESYPGYMECDLLATDNSGNTLAICKDNLISYHSLQKAGFRDIPQKKIKTANSKALFVGPDMRFYLVLSSGILQVLDPSTRNTTHKLLTEEHLLHEKEILSAFYEDSCLFFVDKKAQLYRYSINNRQKVFLHDLSGMVSQHGNISKICTFQSSIYIAFRNGIILNLSQPEEPRDMGIGIFYLMKDKRQEILWVGTDGQGLYMFYNKPDLIGSILLKDLPINIQNPVRSLYTDEDHSLWFGTKGDGIIRLSSYEDYNNKPIPRQAIQHFTTRDGLASNRVYCFHRSRYHPVIWIGTEGPGLSYYSYQEKRIKALPQANNLPAIQYVHAICEVNDSTLWLATTGNGLVEVVMSPGQLQGGIKRITSYFLKCGENVCREIQSMVYDNDSTLFLGSRGGYGLISFNLHSKHYHFLQDNNLENPAIGDVLSVCQVEDSVFYIGASSGLTRVEFKNNKMFSQQFDRSNGIANDMIHGIHLGLDSCIWLSTNKGLTKYNPRNHFFHNYHQNLSVTEFSDDAYWKCPYSGRLFFGGINGLAWINNITPPGSTYQPDLNFTELQLDKQVRILNKDICAKGGLTLPAVQSLSITFTAPDYIDGENYEYSYLLTNYNTSWTELQKSNRITFTNLPHGEYLLKVRYRNDVINLQGKEYTLPIRILPPLYASKSAIVIYILISLILLFLLFYRIRYQIVKKQRQIAQKLQKEQKEMLYEAKLNFFTHITHELCTPLTLINGVQNYIQAYASTKQDVKLEKYTSILRDNVNDLNQLIQEILDFRKAEDSGFGNSMIRKISVSDLLRTQYEYFYPLSEQRQIRFSLNLASDLYWNTDPMYFKKILTNLISNAFKYTEAGGTINLSLSIEKSKLIFKVYNTGQGIKDEDKEAVFDRYRILGTAEGDMKDTARNGLGLFICNSLVRSLQGDIDIQSESGVFAEFIVTLPWLEARENTTAKETVEKSPPPLSESATNLHTPDHTQEAKTTILVIDDHKDILWLISETLSPHYTILEAHNGKEALDLLKLKTPALIITDIMMPGMDGLELMAHIKKNKYMRNIPLIIISAKISDEEQAIGLNSGADAYLTKPFSPTVLLSIVNRLMQNKKELRDYFYSPESAIQFCNGQPIHLEDKEFMDNVIRIIKENIGQEGLGPDLIAEKLHINTRALYRRFKKISSVTPSDFIKDYRLCHAAQLLINTNLNIQEIIYNVGISNKSYFYREFARKYGMTPKEYRNNR